MLSFKERENQRKYKRVVTATRQSGSLLDRQTRRTTKAVDETVARIVGESRRPRRERPPHFNQIKHQVIAAQKVRATTRTRQRRPR